MTQGTVSSTPPKNIYLNNKELLIAVRESKEIGKMSPKLAQMLTLLCAKYAAKGNWVNYTYNDDMQAYALLMLVRTWNSFDLNKSSNPFAFYTQCIKNSFTQYLNQEKRQRTIRDLLLVDQGLNPSFGFGESDESASDQHFTEDEQDFYFYKETAQELQKQLTSEDELFRDEDGIIEEESDDEDGEINDPEELPLI